MLRTLMIFLGIISLYMNSAECLIVAHAIEVRLTVEDGDMGEATVTSVKFAGEEIDLSKKSFMNRKVVKKINISPGQYQLEWTTEKSESPWGKKETKKHLRILAFELTDTVVYINIRGENITTY